MKLSPEYSKITERMAPGVLSRDGFLGSDRRPLPEILDADRSTVEGLGLSHEAIAEKLEEILHQAMEHYGTPVKVGDDLQAVYIEAMGRIPCPFGDATVRPKGQVDLRELSTGREISFTPLSVHMIAEHGFYQGHGSAYRVEPALAAEMLRLG